MFDHIFFQFLGHDLGIYRNEPLKELGYVKGDLLRSARLVIDVGIHLYGWSRKSAIDFLMNNTGYSQETAAEQVDRYISTPGQAVAYKVGERVIQMLRKKFTKESDMTLKKFHTYMLNCVGPLDDLKACILDLEQNDKQGNKE